MRTKVRTKDFNFNNKIDTSKSGKYFKIPDFVKEEINEKGFYLYEWIDNKELKTSIEIDFLKKMLYIGPIGFIIMIFFAFMGSIIASFWFLGIFTALLIIYLMILSISRSIIASKINFLIITSEYFSINRKIGKIENNSIFLDDETIKISERFEEDLFSNSRLGESKKNVKNLYNKGLKGFLDGTKDIKINSSSKDSGQAIILIIGLLIAFFLTMSLVYLFGIFLVVIFGGLTANIIKKYLIWKGHLVILIDEYFKNIEKYSANLKSAKDILANNLEEAAENNWQDGLFLKIEKGISTVNKNANKSFDANIKLIEIVKNSEYNDIFDYGLYNSWLRRQVIVPIKGVIKMLEKSIGRMDNEIKKIDENIENATDEKLSSHLEIAKNRILIKRKKAETEKNSMQEYLNKINK